MCSLLATQDILRMSVCLCVRFLRDIPMVTTTTERRTIDTYILSSKSVLAFPLGEDEKSAGQALGMIKRTRLTISHLTLAKALLDYPSSHRIRQP